MDVQKLVRLAADTGKPYLLVVSPCCPVGCGFEVVFLRSVADGSVFCFCDLCGCGFWRPEEAQANAGLAYIIDGSEMAPEGAGIATYEDVVAAGFEDGILGTLTLDEWGEDGMDDLNDRVRSRSDS